MWRFMRVVVVQTRWHCHQKLPRGMAQSTRYCVETSRIVTSTNQKKHFSPNMKIIEPWSARNWEESSLGDLSFQTKAQIFLESLLLGWNPSLTSKRGVDRELSTSCTSVTLEETGSSREQMQRQKTVARRQSSVDFMCCAAWRNSCRLCAPLLLLASRSILRHVHVHWDHRDKWLLRYQTFADSVELTLYSFLKKIWWNRSIICIMILSLLYFINKFKEFWGCVHGWECFIGCFISMNKIHFNGSRIFIFSQRD